MDYSIQSVLDGMGLRFLEWSPSLLKAVSLKDTQLAWIEAAAIAKEKADAAKKDPSQPVYGSLFPESPLATVALPPVLADLVDEGQQDPLLITATLLQAAGCTALPLFIATAAGTDAVGTLEASAVAESRRLAMREATQLEKNAAFRSKPKLNPCVHVDKIEQIRGVRDTKKRMDLLDDYIQKTAVGQHNQWILCGLCKLPLVCKHEKLLIEEQQHPGRSTILHKTLLLEYAKSPDLQADLADASTYGGPHTDIQSTDPQQLAALMAKIFAGITDEDRALLYRFRANDDVPGR
jgi:hypothetical protein